MRVGMSFEQTSPSKYIQVIPPSHLKCVKCWLKSNKIHLTKSFQPWQRGSSKLRSCSNNTIIVISSWLMGGISWQQLLFKDYWQRELVPFMSLWWDFSINQMHWHWSSTHKHQLIRCGYSETLWMLAWSYVFTTQDKKIGLVYLWWRQNQETSDTIHKTQTAQWDKHIFL